MNTMKKLGVVLVWVAVGLVHADVLEKTKAWSDKLEPAERADQLYRFGFTEKASRDVLTVGWNESAVVDEALKREAVRFLESVAHRDGLTAESLEKIRVHQASKPVPNKYLWGLVIRLPLEERAAFEEILRKGIPQRYGSNTLLCELELKYKVLQGRKNVIGGHTETSDLVALLLLPRPMSMRPARDLKGQIKSRAVKLARRQLRSEGKSFVATDETNPLADRVAPVVDALNAPACVGLEAALRQLGADVPDVDRTELKEKVRAWHERILSGDLTVKRTQELIGRLSIGLGVDGFNAFVKVYNDGGPTPEIL